MNASGSSIAPLPDTVRTLRAGDREYRYHALAALRDGTGLPIDALPVTLKILLENLVRHCDEGVVSAGDVLELANWSATCEAGEEVAFHPVRILMPDSSGIPLLADLAAMRDATTRFGGDPAAVNPHVPLDLIVDHTVTIDVSGVPDAAAKNLELDTVATASATPSFAGRRTRSRA